MKKTSFAEPHAVRWLSSNSSFPVDLQALCFVSFLYSRAPQGNFMCCYPETGKSDRLLCSQRKDKFSFPEGSSLLFTWAGGGHLICRLFLQPRRLLSLQRPRGCWPLLCGSPSCPLLENSGQPSHQAVTSQNTILSLSLGSPPK